MRLLPLWLRSPIQYRLERVETRDSHGDATGWDFASFRELKSWVADALACLACPRCGQAEIGGRGVVARYSKVRLFRHCARRNWWGRTSIKDRHVRTVWRLHEIGLRSGRSRAGLHLLELGEADGHLRCNASACPWRVEGGGGWSMSLWDIYQAVQERRGGRRDVLPPRPPAGLLALPATSSKHARGLKH